MLSEKNYGIIYLITNIKNNKIFIGQINNYKIIKWNNHKWSAELELGEILYKDKLVGYRVRITFEGKK